MKHSSKPKETIQNAMIEDLVDDVFGDSMHKKRVESIANATIGVVKTRSLAIHIIGQGLAQAKDLSRRHCVKQVDRLLSNEKLNLDDCFEEWIPYVISDREEIKVSMDWTEFDADDHSTLMISMITGHSRSTPLIWKTSKKSKLKNKMNDIQYNLLSKLKDYLPANVKKVTVVADRGFQDIKLFEYIKQALGFDYLIRIKENISIIDKHGKEKKAKKWIIKGGRARTIKGAYITGENYQVAKVVCVKKPAMKEAWFLAMSDEELTATQAIRLYGKRWGIETSFRDIKDYKFGMGMRHMHTKSTLRRDKLFLVSALAIALLTLLGAAGDAADLERTIKVNTVKHRCYSFFSQGCIYYAMLPGMRDEWFRPLMRMFDKLLKERIKVNNILSIL